MNLSGSAKRAGVYEWHLIVRITSVFAASLEREESMGPISVCYCSCRSGNRTSRVEAGGTDMLHVSIVLAEWWKQKSQGGDQ